MAKTVAFLTTFDNPFNPMTNFEEWLMFDCLRGYNSCAYLDRIAQTSDVLTDDENTAEIERAIDEIVKYNPTLYYKLELSADGNKAGSRCV